MVYRAHPQSEDTYMKMKVAIRPDDFYAPDGMFRVIYKDPRGSEKTFDRDCASLAEVREYLGGMLADQRACMLVYDEDGDEIDPFL